jgi:hypothetical protein
MPNQASAFEDNRAKKRSAFPTSDVNATKIYAIPAWHEICVTFYSKTPFFF